MKKKLIFRIGEESVPAILGPEEYMDSPFADALSEGKKEFVRLWNQVDGFSKSLKAEREKGCHENMHLKGEECPNNILAFLGDRGSGKTSSLLSLKNIVEKDPNDREVRKMASQSVFLPIIEPAFFDINHNILDIFVGELYRNTKALLSKWDGLPKSEREKLRKLQNVFAQVKNALIFLEKSRSEELHEEQESLLCLSEGVNLVKLMTSLVESYLDCTQKKVLVVSIDDIDLNIGEAYVMLEQIRKYLKVPKVVVLLAAKFEQLKNCIEVYLIDRYDKSVDQTISREKIGVMAERYLEKLLPVGQRISMPVMTDYADFNLEIIPRGAAEADKEYSSDNTVEFAVLSLIYKKCGYLFYNSDEGSSLIIPRNLRSLKQLVTMLYEMEDPADSGTIHLHNKTIFKDYFLTQWTGLLSSREREIALKVWNERKPGAINKLTISLLKSYYRELERIEERLEENRLNDDCHEIEHVRLLEILDDSTRPENISVGDVAVVLRFLRSVIVEDDRKLLIFYLTSFYSMRLYELYDEMTAQTADPKFPLSSEKNDKFPKLRRSKIKAIPDYFRFVGHGFFTKVGDMMMPESILGKSREMVRIDGILVFQLISDVIDMYSRDNGCITQPEFILKLNLAEFFIVCVARRLDYERQDYSPKDLDFWRENDGTPGDFEPFDRSDKNLLFDITSPFLNLIYPKFAYDRFDSRIYEIASKCERSLLHRLYKSGRRYKNDDNAIRDLMSRMALRNMEVLDDLDIWLRKQKASFPQDNNVRELDCLIQFFDGFKTGKDGYEVKTYLKNDSDNSDHTITFTPLTLLTNILRSLSVKPDDSTLLKPVKKNLLGLFVQIMKQEGSIHKDTNYDAGEIIAILRNSLEENVAEKEKVISDIIEQKNLVSVKGLFLVEYIAEYKVYSKYLFTEFLDKEAGQVYRGMIIRDLERRCSVAQADWREAQKKVDNMQSQLNLMKAQVGDIIVNIRKADKTLKQHRDKFTELSERLKKAEDTYNKRLEKIEKGEKSVAEIDESLKSFKESRNEMRSRVKMLEMFINLRENAESEEKGPVVIYHPVNKDILTMRSEYTETKNAIEQVDKEIKELEERKRRMTESLRTHQLYQKHEEETLKDCREEINGVSKLMDEAEMQLSVYRQEEMRISMNIKERETALEELKRKARALKKAYTDLDEDRKKILDVLKPTV